MLPSVPQHSVSTAPGAACSTPATALRISRRSDVSASRPPLTAPNLCMPSRAKPDAGRAVTPLARPGRRVRRAQIRPVVAVGVVAGIFEAMHSAAAGAKSSRPVAAAKRRQRIGKAGGAVRHAVNPCASACAPRPWPIQLRRPSRPDAALRQQMLAAFDRALRAPSGEPAVAIKPQQAEDRAGAAAHDVELLVRGDQFVGEQPRRRLARRREGRRRRGTWP